MENGPSSVIILGGFRKHIGKQRGNLINDARQERNVSEIIKLYMKVKQEYKRKSGKFLGGSRFNLP